MGDLRLDNWFLPYTYFSGITAAGEVLVQRAK